jgi:phage major head subunit gpT-like protein
MTLLEFTGTLAADAPPALGAALVALWYDGKGSWDKAHEVAQDIDDATGAWIHAYLHRKEGDEGNAAYWYRRAGKPVERGPLDGEWASIVTALLSD